MLKSVRHPDAGCRPEGPGTSLFVNAYGSRIAVTVAVAPETDSRVLTFFVPEPVGGNSVVAVIKRPGDAAALLDILDVTEADREKFGGYSLLRISARKDRRFKLPASTS